ncbi:class D sortase [Clostridium magnum]|uniref:Sortase family protein n=1 Tax=Clostridium magnum DSM 2767 TaxID=1121326 RepID=A0A162U4A3_9CLOT|nr:class D sortase [Clostridium magnum]KZL93410.1 sortase family protein [Clostridium magnum DSM 2767]SHJ32005.1 sortase A [Clostridium magnum DSM 2767]
MKKIIGIIMILAGISLIAFSGFAKYKVYKNQKDMINAFENTIKDVDKEKTYTDDSEIKSKDLDNIKGAIGIITIPKINLKAAICEGIESENLKYAVGHFPGTPLPGEMGNFCIAGHRSYTYGEFFNRLDELQVDDEIIVKTNINEYKYKVYEKKVVEPSEISVLDNTKEPIITLVTCTPIRIATHRLIIKGKLE